MVFKFKSIWLVHKAIEASLAEALPYTGIFFFRYGDNIRTVCTFLGLSS